MSQGLSDGAVVGITDDGYMIVTENHCCPHWNRTDGGLSGVKECWYCRYADFRKSTGVHISCSICRCPENRVDTQMDFRKNEE